MENLKEDKELDIVFCRGVSISFIFPFISLLKAIDKIIGR